MERQVLLIEQKNKERIFFVHTINLHDDQSYYLTQTQIWADEDLGRVYRLEVKYCDRLVSQDGQGGLRRPSSGL